MSINKSISSIRDQFSSYAWKEASGQDEARVYIAQQAREETQRLQGILEESSQLSIENREQNNEFKKARDRLVLMCQKGYELYFGVSDYDRVWVTESVEYLRKIYDPIICRVVHYMKKNHTSLNSDDAEQDGRILFMRFIVGDTPWNIRKFGTAEKATGTDRLVVSKVLNYRKVQSEKNDLLDKISILEDRGYSRNDVNFERWLLDEFSKTIPYWIARRPRFSYRYWVWRFLKDQFEVFSNSENNMSKENYQQRIEQFSKVLKDKKLFDKTIKLNSDFFHKEYRLYKKRLYLDEKYDPVRVKSFPAYLQRFLKYRLLDYYESIHSIKTVKGVDVDQVSAKSIYPVSGSRGGKSNHKQKEYIDIKTVTKVASSFQNKLNLTQYKVAVLLQHNYKKVEIANELGLSKGRISQIHSQIKRVLSS